MLAIRFGCRSGADLVRRAKQELDPVSAAGVAARLRTLCSLIELDVAAKDGRGVDRILSLQGPLLAWMLARLVLAGSKSGAEPVCPVPKPFCTMSSRHARDTQHRFPR